MQKTLTMLAFMTMASIGAIAQPKLNKDNIKDNIEDVLNAMTLEEKASLLVGKSRFVIMNGVPTGTTSKVEGAAGETRAIERLGIPGTVLSDGPAGVRISPTRKGDDNTYYATAFPVGTVLAESDEGNGRGGQGFWHRCASGSGNEHPEKSSLRSKLRVFL